MRLIKLQIYKVTKWKYFSEKAENVDAAEEKFGSNVYKRSFRK